jgi:hypothetical protein
MERILKIAAGAAAILLVSTSGAMAKHSGHHHASAKSHSTAAHATGSLAQLGGKPNLNGIWEAMSGADFGLEPHNAGQAPAAPEKLGAAAAIPASRGAVDGGTIPYLPAALEQREKNVKSTPAGDPEGACYLPGIPRATYINDHAFQIIQAADGDMLFAYEYANANRIIYMQKAVEPPIDTWMGTSYGQWEGNTLVVTTLGQNGMTWLDRAGNYLSPTAKVTERFTLVDHDHIAYEATIEDPSVYSKPWKISMPLYRHVEPNAQLMEFNCVPFADLLVYGDLLQNKDGK